MASLSLHFTSTFPRPLLWLIVEVVVSSSPLSLLVEASLIQHSLLEGFVLCASVLPRPLSQLATEVAIYASLLSLFIVASLIQDSLLEDSS